MVVKKNTRKYSKRKPSKRKSKRKKSFIGGKSNKAIEPSILAKDTPEGTIKLGKDGFYWKNVNGVWGKPASQHILVEEYNKQEGHHASSQSMPQKEKKRKTSSKKEKSNNKINSYHKPSNDEPQHKPSNEESHHKPNNNSRRESKTNSKRNSKKKIIVPTSFVKETPQKDGQVLDLVKELISKTINLKESTNATKQSRSADVLMLPSYTCTKTEQKKEQKKYKYEFLEE